MSKAAWKRSVVVVLLFQTTCLAVCLGQTKPFDVVTIKASDTSTGGMGLGMSTPDSISLINTPVKSLIARAYAIKEDSVLSGESWINSKEYDIEAKVLPDANGAVARLNRAEIQGKMKVLLADRFGLVAHFETKTIPIYELVVSPAGSRLKEANPAETYPNGIKMPGGQSGPGLRIIKDNRFTGQGIQLSGLVDTLEMILHRTVVDKTNLEGHYDISFPIPVETPDTESELTSPSLFTVLNEQLGLRLKSSKGQGKILMVDHIEKPSAN